jgi:hypothetical protein
VIQYNMFQTHLIFFCILRYANLKEVISSREQMTKKYFLIVASVNQHFIKIYLNLIFKNYDQYLSSKKTPTQMVQWL